MDEEPDIVYEPPPRITELSGNEDQADAATFAAACALLMRYTSKAYIAESAALFGEVVDAFENWPDAMQRLGAQTLPEWTAEPVAEKLGPMAARISTTLSAHWAYQTLMADTPTRRDDEPLEAVADAPTTATGLLIPKTGIWVPTTIRYGCPNFLIAGQPAPPMTRACTRYDYAASDGGGLEPPRPAWSDYEYAEKPTVWRMVWYDTRYRAGT